MSNPQRISVLVVDRDEGTTAQLKSVLTADGYQVQTINEVERAADEVRTGRPQAVILDGYPGEQAGLAAPRQMRPNADALGVLATAALARVRTISGTDDI